MGHLVPLLHASSAPTPTPEAMLAAAKDLNNATWALTHATQNLVIVGALAFVAAAVSAGLLFWQLQAQIREQRLARAMNLVNEFREGLGDRPSASSILATLSYEHYSELARSNAMQSDSVKAMIATMRDNFGVMHEYFQRAAYLYKNNLVDRTYFMNRQWHVIELSYKTLKPWYEVFPNTGKGPLGIEYLLPLAEKYERSQTAGPKS